MRNYLLIFLLTFGFAFNSGKQVFAQEHMLRLSSDSLRLKPSGFALNTNWKFSETDDQQIAGRYFDDSKWKTLNPELLITSSVSETNPSFNQPMWFRLSFTADTGITNLPLALNLTHPGASEIYLDGAKIASFGTVEREKPIYYNPQDVPFTFYLPTAGEHVIAVRYTNAGAWKNHSKYAQDFAGFRMRIGFANQLIQAEKTRSVYYTFMCLLMVGIFVSLAISHLFLYIYHLASKSNLFFCLFCLGLAASFLIPFANRVSVYPEVELLNTYSTFFVKAINCYSLSGFINELFSNNKKRFRIITIFCTATLVFSFFNAYYGNLMFYVLLLLVSSEATLLTVRAMYKKVKGARIIGTGLLLFIVFLIAFSIIKFHYSINDDDIALHSSGKLYMLMIVCIMLCLPISMSLYLAFNFAALNRSLVHSNKKLRELISFNAHQIREPLTRITGAMSVREYVDSADEFMSEFMPQMEKAANDLDNAIKDVLERAQEQGE